MTTAATPASSSAIGAVPTPRQQYLDALDREHATTMKVLRAYPPDKADLKPHPKSKSARDLAWIFVLERGLGKAGLNNVFASGQVGGGPPPAPEKWEDILSALEAAQVDYRKLFDSFSDDELMQPVKFFVGPGTLADFSRLAFAWFLLCDEIHHRGQISVYLRMADGRVPSIYGPSLDEPWF